MWRRRDLLRAAGGAALAGAGLARAARGAALPAVLREPALQTPLAPRAAMLAVVATPGGRRLVAAGERGIVLTSDDGGRGWRQAEVPVQVSLTALCFVDERLGWAAGHGGVLLHTEDGGRHWRLQLDGVRAAQARLAAARARGDATAIERAGRAVAEGPDRPFFDVSFTDARRGLAVGAYGLAFATDDGGATWRPLDATLPDPRGLHLHAICRAGDRTWIVGEQGLMLQSADGLDFEPHASPYKGSLFGILRTASGALVVYGLRGNAFRSEDAGQTWAHLDTGVQIALSDGVALGAHGLVLVAQTGELLASRDDGRTLHRLALTAPPPATALAAAPDGALVVASLRGLRRIDLPPNA